MNEIDDLKRMANQITHFFAAYPEEEAVKGIAQHIADFWTPAMRRKLDAHVEKGGEGLHPLAVLAARNLASEAA